MKRFLPISCLMMLLGCGSEAPTTVVVRAATLDPVRGASRLTLDADVSLSVPMAEALNNGVELVLQWQLELRTPGQWWDKTLASDTRDLALSYHSLSGRYLLTGLDEPRNFNNLESLLGALGRSSTLMGVSPPELGESPAFWRVRARLDRSGLPPPLRLPAWISPAWRIRSDWYEWPQAPTA